MNTADAAIRETGAAVARHLIPFVVWIGIMSLPMRDVALHYTLQTSVSLLVLLVLKPWRYYAALKIRLLPLGVLVGVGVAAIWIFSETLCIHQFSNIHRFYVHYFIWGKGQGNGPLYAPEQCGWTFSLIRLAGSALVIAVIEEFFWRGFFMRMLAKGDFLSVDPRKIGWGVISVVALVFGFEHGDRWLVGLMAGLAYGLLYRLKGDLAAVVVAHVTTNYLLGLYVLANGAYQFW